MTTKQELYQKISKLKNQIKQILNFYLIDTNIYKLKLDEGSPKYVLRIHCWAGPRRGLGFVAKEIVKLLRENGIDEVGKIFIEYELLKRKKQNIKATLSLGEKLSALKEEKK